MEGEYLKHYDLYVPSVEYRFLPKRKGTQITLDQIEREIHACDGWGQLYAVFIKVEDEFPAGYFQFADVYSAYEAAKRAADYENLYLVSDNGLMLAGNEEKMKKMLLEKWGIKNDGE